MSDWERVSLGEVLALDVEAVPVRPTAWYDIVGVLNRGRGLLRRESIRGDETSYKTLNRIRPNQIIYSRLKAFEGAITVAPHDLGSVYASQEFPTFTCGERLLPAFFALLTTTKDLWDTLQNLSTGMGGRRERVKPVDFLTLQTALPSIPEQRRIVDVIAAIDALVDAVAREIDLSERTAWILAEDALADVERVPLESHLMRVVGGRSPMTTGKPPGDDEHGVLKVSAVTPFRFIAEEAKALAPNTPMPEDAAVSPGDILITRANTPLRVGAVCRVPQHVRKGLYLSDKTLRIVPAASVDPDYLVVAMGLRTSRDHLTSSATGTSASMYNVSQAKIRQTPVPLPSLETQTQVAALVNSAHASVDASRTELAELRTFRSALLTSLLSQETEVPESYDRLLEEVS